MFKEKIIQISGNKILTNKGRVYESFLGVNGTFWQEITLPTEISNEIPIKGETQFVEPVTKEEKFNNANDIGDLIKD